MILHTLAARLSEQTGTPFVVRKCVYGHGYPRCGCSWKLYRQSATGALNTVLYLGDTKPKAELALRGVLYGLTLTPTERN